MTCTCCKTDEERAAHARAMLAHQDLIAVRTDNSPGPTREVAHFEPAPGSTIMKGDLVSLDDQGRAAPIRNSGGRVMGRAMEDFVGPGSRLVDEIIDGFNTHTHTTTVTRNDDGGQ